MTRLIQQRVLAMPSSYRPCIKNVYDTSMSLFSFRNIECGVSIKIGEASPSSVIGPQTFYHLQNLYLALSSPLFITIL